LFAIQNKIWDCKRVVNGLESGFLFQNTAQMTNLAESTIIVTGGSRGYGAGIAEALVKAGAQVWITGRDATKPTKTAQRTGAKQTSRMRPICRRVKAPFSRSASPQPISARTWCKPPNYLHIL
jgi:hypothetical protein